MIASHCFFRRTFRAVGVALVGLALFSTTVRAGTPLICHPYDIGNAKSLPSGPDWHGVSKAYDRSRLVDDTLALLTPDMPILVRMETLRRAAIYATAYLRDWDKERYTPEDRRLATALLEKLRERAAAAKGEAEALAVFDVGFFSETLRQTRLDTSLDGYALLQRALELRGRPDAEIEFALALAASWPKRSEQAGHIARARAGAKTGSVLAANLESRFAAN